MSVLADGFARRAGRDYWQFHRQLVAGVGAEIRMGDLALPVLWWYLDRIGNPMRTIQNLLRRGSQR